MAMINGTGGNDTIRPVEEGGSLNGLANATAQGDTINGLGGNDQLSGGGGPDIINGGAGSDTILGGAGDDSLAADSITSNNSDYLFGGEGNDTLRAAPFNPDQFFSLLFGGTGNDTIIGNGDPFSWADYADRPLPVVVDLAAGTAVVNGTETDTLVGVLGARGGTGNDTFIGTPTFELFAPGLGNNTVNGAGGDDYLLYADLAIGVDVDLAAGTAIHLADGSTDTLIGTFTIAGTTFNDILRGDSGNNTIRPLNGADLVDGRDGFDTVRYSTTFGFTNGATIFSANDPVAQTQGAVVDLVAGTAIDPWGATDQLVSIEAALGTQRADTMLGNAVANTFTGSGGDDVLEGGDGDDVLDGGDGSDTLRGGDGNDTIRTGTTGGAFERAFGDAGNDDITGATTTNSFTNLFGGGGNDTIRGNLLTVNLADYADRALAVVANLGVGTAVVDGSETDTLVDVRGIRTGAANDAVTGSTGNDIILVGLGNNTATGGLGFDRISYADIAGSVTIDLLAGTAIKTADGSTDIISGFEVMQGTNEADTLLGDDLDNEFRGIAGNDLMDGRGGYDTAIYNTNFSGGAVIFSATGSFPITTGVTVNLATGTAIDPWGGTDTLLNIEAAYGTGFADILTGTVTADGSRSQLRGLGGNDVLQATAQDTAVTADYRGDAALVLVNLSDSGANLGGQFIAAGTARDGSNGTDTLVMIQSIRGSNFNDVILGGARNDRLEGEGGDDAIDGGAGNDRVRGNAGNDALQGGDGDDALRGGAGIDTYADSAGYDSIEFSDGGATQGVVASLTTGLITDQYGNAETIGSVNAIEYLIGSELADDLEGKAFSGNIIQLTGGAGNDTLRAGSGGAEVVAAYQLDPDSDGDGIGILADLTLASGQVLDGYGDTDTLVGVGGVRGSNFDDGIIGNDADNWFRGEAGNDIIGGAGGFDILSYANSNRTPTSGITAQMADGAGVIEDGLGGIDLVSGMEQISGSRLADSITISGTQAMRLLGNDGDDVLTGGGGDDYIDGDAGNDTMLDVSGHDAKVDTITGGAGSDTYVLSSFAATSSLVSYTQGWTQWSVATGGNGHWYQTFEASAISWTDGKAYAEAIGGYLATLTSAAENSFTETLLGSQDWWAGGYQADKTNEPAGGWAWVTGEAWSYTDWLTSPLEPDNYGGQPPGVNQEEDKLHLHYRGGVRAWNDLDDAGANFVLQVGGPIDGILVELDFAPLVPDVVTDFQVGPGGDVLDFRNLLAATAGFVPGGTDAFSSGYLGFAYDPNGTYVVYDRDGGGDDFQLLLFLEGVLPGLITPENYLVPPSTNTAPAPFEDSVVGDEDTVITGNVLANDGDPNGDPLTARLIADATHGIVVLNADGNFTYTPTADFNGDDYFIYKANDGQADSVDVLVFVTVSAVNDAPTDLALSNATVAENAALGTLVGLLSAFDVEGDPLSFSLVGDPGPFSIIGNELRVAGLIDFEATPSLSVTVRATDSPAIGVAASADATFAITVTDVNEGGGGSPPAYTFSQGFPGTPPANQAPPPASATDVAAFVRSGTATLDGTAYSVIENIGAWNAIKNITLGSFDTAFGTAYAIANFVSVDADFSAAGGTGLDLLLSGVKRSDIVTADGADEITLLLHSNGWGLNENVVRSGGGNDTVLVTGVGNSTLDNALLADNGLPSNGPLWNANFNGGFDTAVTVEAGAGDDTVTVAGNIAARIFGGAGLDVLTGGAGRDLIDGGADADVLAGGAGRDTFLLRQGEAVGDVVADFAAGDVIRLVGFGAGASLASLGGGQFQVGTETFTVSGATTLVAGVDYIFA